MAIDTPFHCTVELEMNPEPVIVTGVSAEPAMVDEGVIPVMAGTGLEAGGGFVGADAPPPPPQPVINHIPRMKITRIIFAVDFRSIVAFKKIKADILSLKSPNQEGVSSGL